MTDRPIPAPVLSTKEHRRFVEFCDACRRDRYIGLCYGPPGVGKTVSAHAYAGWDRILASRHRPAEEPSALDPAHCHTVLYTPPVVHTPQRLARDVTEACLWLDAVARAIRADQEEPIPFSGDPSFPQYTELLIVDEADRMKTTGLEQLRELYDQFQIGVVLIGMPGLEKRLARYPQLYSRVGFVHAFRPLSAAEVRHWLQHPWTRIVLLAGKRLDDAAVAAIIRITGGNFRLLHRLLTQVTRLMEINALRRVTQHVVEAARESLVIGTV
jgi:DNA transposition AAA+ family ATPase